MDRLNLLIIDDQEQVLVALKGMFEDDYDVTIHADPNAALECIRSGKHPLQLLICDQRMGEVCGHELLAEINELEPNVVAVMLTGYPNLELLINAVNEGHIYAYITKPWRSEELRRIMVNAAEAYRHRIRNKELADQLQEINHTLEQRVEERTAELAERERVLRTEINERRRVEDFLRESEESYRGLAQLTTAVVHNINNVLTSIKTSCGQLDRMITRSRVRRYVKITEMLEENQDNLVEYLTQDPKGVLMPKYMIELGGLLEEELTGFKGEVDNLKEKLSLVEEMATAQQTYAKAEAPVDYDLNLLMDLSLNINRNLLENLGVAVKKRYAEQVSARVPKAQVIHILINLIKNAMEAMDETPRDQRYLVLSSARGASGGIILKIQDHGRGIPADIIKKLFTYGYTTKKDGHGFGLHYCAKAMSEMDGRIDVESPGEGLGTTFTLTFPGSVV